MGRRTASWLMLAAAVAACVVSSVAAYRLSDYSWNQVVDYRSSYLEGSREPGLPGSLEPRVVFVIVDGLGASQASRMPGLETLAEHGAWLTLTASQPSLSYPTWTTMLSGAPQHVSGVTTNWYEGKVGVETLLDTALASGRRCVVVGDGSLDTLYGARRSDAVHFRDWEDGDYLSGGLVDRTLDLAEETSATFVLLHLPDVDETAHDFGTESEEYSQVLGKVDAELERLVQGVQDGRTLFVIAGDHGHIRRGGHGGPEPEVVRTPAVLVGAGAALARAEGRQTDLAPTVAVAGGLPVPRDSLGRVLVTAVASPDAGALRDVHGQRQRSVARYLAIVEAGEPSIMELSGLDDDGLDERMAAAERQRLSREREGRRPLALGIMFGAALVVLALGIASWRALVATIAGVATYSAVFLGGYFLVHGYRWSLSVLNTEEMVESFFMARMSEAAAAGIIASAVAALVYPYLRARPKGPRAGYLGGWLSLGPATVLLVQAVLAVQVSIFIWLWGAEVTWLLPDLVAGFKYDVDLVQMVGLGAAALLSPLVTYMVGKYHPRVVRMDRNGGGATAHPRILDAQQPDSENPAVGSSS